MNDKLKCIRITIILTAIFTLFQGALYLGISIWSILVHNCLQIPQQSDFEKILYFIYFRNGNCGEVKWSSNQTEIRPYLPTITSIAYRTNVIMITYGIISTLWIITSLMVLGSFCSIVNRRSYRYCFIPWLIFVIFGCTIDVIATVFFVNDIFNTQDAEQTLDYLGVKNMIEFLPIIKDYPFIGPSIRLACISSRLVIVWIINIVAVLFSVQMTKLMIRSKEKQQKENISQRQDSPTEIYDNHGFTHDPAPAEPTRAEKRLVPLKSDSSSTSDRRSFENSERLSQIKKKQRPDSLQSDRKINNSNSYHNNLESPTFQLSSPSQGYDDLDNTTNIKSHHYHQVHLSDPQTDETELKKPEKPHITAELRSQLPWSYFGPPSETKTPKHTLINAQHSETHEVLPPIPVPDYTLHFPKKDRPHVSDNSSRQSSVSPRSSNVPSGSRW